MDEVSGLKARLLEYTGSWFYCFHVPYHGEGGGKYMGSKQGGGRMRDSQGGRNQEKDEKLHNKCIIERGKKAGFNKNGIQ